MEKYWKKNPAMTGEVLVTFKGQPLITTDMLEEEKYRILESDDLYAQTIYHMPLKHWLRDMLENMIRNKIVDEYTTEHNIKLTGDEISYYDMLTGGRPQVSDAQAKAFYDEQISKGTVYNDSFEEVKERLKAKIRIKIRREGFEKILSVLMKEYEVVVNEDYFKDDDCVC